MHDLADKKYVTLPEDTTLYDHFLPFFEGLRGSAGSLDVAADGRLREIVRIIENVSWTTEKRLRAEGKVTSWYEGCRELHCVQDADRLDAIGAFGERADIDLEGHPTRLTSFGEGIMRCAAYSATVNRPLFVPPEEVGGDPGASAIAHFHDKLLLIRERLKTDAGRAMGERRHKLVGHLTRGVLSQLTTVRRRLSGRWWSSSKLWTTSTIAWLERRS